MWLKEILELQGEDRGIVGELTMLVLVSDNSRFIFFVQRSALSRRLAIGHMPELAKILIHQSGN